METYPIEPADFIGKRGNTIECIKTDNGFTFCCEDGNNPRNDIRVSSLEAVAMAKFILQEVHKLD